jgi:hypothetical protein
MMHAIPMASPPAVGMVAAPGQVHEAMESHHSLQDLASRDPSFARALKRTGSTHAAASLAREHGLNVSAEALWRNRGRHGLPTWRG